MFKTDPLSFHTDYVYWHIAKELLHQPINWILPNVFYQGSGKIGLIQNKESDKPDFQ
jgi:hypothetical protein